MNKMFTKINIEIIPYKEQRYPTLGDYWFDESGVLQIRACNEDIHGQPVDFRFTFGIILHELFEFGVITHRGITIEDIEKFDKAYNGSDPGAHPEAPYHKEHMKALAVEEMYYNEVGYEG